MKFVILLVFMGMLMITTVSVGCASDKNELIEVPGAEQYGILFEINWANFDSGTFSYGPEGSTVRQIGGHRLGYLAFYDLTLDFSFKDGRVYHEVIDVNTLMRELVNEEPIFDVRKTTWGGVAMVVIAIEDDELRLEYLVSERILEPDYELNNHYYPLYKKVLN